MRFSCSPHRRIGKELEKELEMEEQNGEGGDKTGVSGTEGGVDEHNDGAENTVKSMCRELSKRIYNMPQQIRAVHAQREKEKGNEVCTN
ncbi:unnamed protein product [Hydatigera taeniaeformis]|uniref:Uncharacterized protein n=1 Tax=Hydatigena taeniaeformis TaxID=6205 RepID=A0A0R3WXU2_HYDTA|nr:unnamed protein product [Hydatigera taeniaeformis]